MEIETRLLVATTAVAASTAVATNILLIQGMGGTGKTTLIKHLLEWWQTTCLAAHVFTLAATRRRIPWNKFWMVLPVTCMGPTMTVPTPSLGCRQAAKAGAGTAQPTPSAGAGQPGVDHWRCPGYPAHSERGGTGPFA
ncbi:MAG: hypothetical protein H6660_11345 [Ardenticatenaceae bacterium]|nr:hypothetical protein [Ardenticatenaceae bacterium]